MGKSLKPLERQTLRERVVEAVRAFILENSLRPGDRLPTEHELAKRLAVGRSCVREALKSLEATGFVESRPRTGCVLKAADLRLLSGHLAFSAQANGAMMAELLEARALLEIGVIPLAAEKADPAALEEMSEGLRMMEAAAGAQDWREAEKRFHAALFRGARNPVLQSFHEVIEGFFAGQKAQNSGLAWDIQKWLETHRGIYEALKNRDATLARALTEACLNGYAGMPENPPVRQVA